MKHGGLQSAFITSTWRNMNPKLHDWRLIFWQGYSNIINFSDLNQSTTHHHHGEASLAFHHPGDQWYHFNSVWNLFLFCCQYSSLTSWPDICIISFKIEWGNEGHISCYRIALIRKWVFPLIKTLWSFLDFDPSHFGVFIYCSDD